MVAPRARATVLVVEDDPSWADIVTRALEQAGYTARAEPDGTLARQALDTTRPDLIVLDLGLPDDDGLLLCTDLKERTGVPILVCSATKRRAERVLSLHLADDFVSKPCDLDELVARVDALLRQTRAEVAPVPEPPREVRAGALVVHRRRPDARVGDSSARLTAAEHRLLLALAEQPGRVMSREELAALVLHGSPSVGSRALDMHVQRLRAKLAGLGPTAPRIVSERGFGVALDPALPGD